MKCVVVCSTVLHCVALWCSRLVWSGVVCCGVLKCNMEWSGILWCCGCGGVVKWGGFSGVFCVLPDDRRPSLNTKRNREAVEP